MIESLKIKNVALARNIFLNFTPGFNVFLGETGAGKSIILDALNFVLGAKANQELITTGENQMRVEVAFRDFSSDVLNELDNLGFERDEILIIVRTLEKNGKSDIKINGNSATLSMLKSLTRFLVDSYSQHENLILLKQKNHIFLLDSFNPNFLTFEKEKLSYLILKLKEIEKQINIIGGSGENRERLIDLLQYQINEIESVKPTPLEEQELIEAITKFNNSEKIVSSLSECNSCLNSSQFSAITQLKNGLRNLSSIENLSENYTQLYERLKNSIYEIEDIAFSVKDELNSVDFDQRKFDLMDARLDKLKSLKKKYGGDVSKVLEFLTKAKLELDNLLNGEEKLANLTTEKNKFKKEILEFCQILNKKRNEISAEIEKKIKIELEDLGMKNARFKVKIEIDENSFSKNGYDNVEFLFSANAGEDLKPLSKIISGGEMSRFMLAIKNIIAGEKTCLVFDEVDSGISGRIGAAVAERIARLSMFNQVICISHSAQVCAMADNYYFISKIVDDGKTTSFAENIKSERIVDELSKLSGGKLESEIIKKHAQELLNWAQNFKKNLNKEAI